MNTYDIIYEELCNRVETGELTLEDAEVINDLAYERYVSEASKEVADKFEDLGKKKRRLERLEHEIEASVDGTRLRGTGSPKGNANTQRKKNIRSAFKADKWLEDGSNKDVLLTIAQRRSKRDKTNLKDEYKKVLKEYRYGRRNDNQRKNDPNNRSYYKYIKDEYAEEFGRKRK